MNGGYSLPGRGLIPEASQEIASVDESRVEALLLLAETREHPGERTVWLLVDPRGLKAFGSNVLHAARSIVATYCNDGCNVLVSKGKRCISKQIAH